MVGLQAKALNLLKPTEEKGNVCGKPESWECEKGNGTENEDGAGKGERETLAPRGSKNREQLRQA